MFVPLILVCSMDFGCKTIAGPSFKDLESCTRSLAAGRVVLAPRLSEREWIAGERV